MPCINSRKAVIPKILGDRNLINKLFSMNVTSLVKSWPIMRKVAPVVDLSKICSLVEGNCEFFSPFFFSFTDKSRINFKSPYLWPFTATNTHCLLQAAITANLLPKYSTIEVPYYVRCHDNIALRAFFWSALSD